MEKKQTNYEDINITVSFSVLHCFCSTGYLLLIIAHERMYLLSINTKEGSTQDETRVPSRVPLLCMLPGWWFEFIFRATGRFVHTLTDQTLNTIIYDQWLFITES